MCKHTFSACKHLKSGVYLLVTHGFVIQFNTHATLDMHHMNKFIASTHLVSHPLDDLLHPLDDEFYQLPYAHLMLYSL